jgi:hypothetical protein
MLLEEGSCEQRGSKALSQIVPWLNCGTPSLRALCIRLASVQTASGTVDLAVRITPGNGLEDEIIPNRQQRRMTGFPRLRSKDEGMMVRGQIRRLADLAPLFHGDSPVIHNSLWAMRRSGIGVC